jgi:hypothetical protein
VPDDRDELVHHVQLVRQSLYVGLVAGSQDCFEELFLRAEVVQQTGLAQADGGGEFTRRRLAVAVPGDHLQRGAQDLLALGDPLRVRASGRCHIQNLASLGFRAYSDTHEPDIP